MRVRDTRATGEVGEVIFKEPALAYLDEDVHGICTVDGKQLSRSFWPKGSVLFYPAGATMTMLAFNGHTSNVIALGDPLLHAAADGVFDRSRVDFRHADVTSPLIASLAESSRLAETDPVLSGMPRVAGALPLALAVAVMAHLSPDTAALAARMRAGLDQARQRRVVEYIDANLSRQISLADLAGVAAMSQFHFARSFKHAVGVPPGRFVWRRRLERAKELLRSERPIAQVALECGFSGQSQFTSAFRAAFGKTPARFRDSLSGLFLFFMTFWEEVGMLMSHA